MRCQGLTIYRVAIHVNVMKTHHGSKPFGYQPLHARRRPLEAILAFRREAIPGYLISETGELLEPEDELWPHSFQLLGMGSGKSFEHILAATRKPDEYLPTVLGGRRTRHQLFGHQSVNQANCAVVAKLQSLRQLSHGDVVAPGEALDGQQRLVLLWRNSSNVRGLFAEVMELPQRITKRRQQFIL